jgi:hypothetical protein
MFQIDVASAAQTMPERGAAGTAGFFTEGDAVGGTQATVLSADFVNAVMMELLNILVGVGLTPSKTDDTQLQKSLPRIQGNSASFPSGLILNWGVGVHADNTGVLVVSYDRPYGTGSLFTLASNRAGSPPTAFHGTDAGNETGMTVYSASAAGVAAAAGTSFWWVSLGK